MCVVAFSFISIAASSSYDLMQKIGNQIWYNEASKKEELLTFWSTREPFPSFGIGHAIWYPENTFFPYTEVFPLLCSYLEDHGKVLPLWLKDSLKKGAPWKDRGEFYADTARVAELRALLIDTIDLQASFMAERLQEKLSLIISSVPEESKEQVERNIALLLSTTLGIYALIDYLNFKGDGLNQKEHKNGERWGLAAVLLSMPTGLREDTASKAFMLSCAEKLLMVLRNSAPEYKTVYAFEGWMKRLSSYCNEKIFKE